VGTAGTSRQQSLVALTPIVLVFALVVIASLRDSDLEEIRIAEHRVGGGEPAAGVSVDSGAIDIDPREPLRQLLHAGNLIGQCVVSHLAVVGVVKRLRSPRRAHAVDLDDYEPKLRQSLRIAAGR